MDAIHRIRLVESLVAVCPSGRERAAEVLNYIVRAVFVEYRSVRLASSEESCDDEVIVDCISNIGRDEVRLQSLAVLCRDGIQDQGTLYLQRRPERMDVAPDGLSPA